MKEEEIIKETLSLQELMLIEEIHTLPNRIIKCMQQHHHQQSKAKDDSIQADINNKLSPISNLIEMLYDKGTIINHDNYKMKGLILEEIEKSRKMVSYLSNIINKH